MKESLKKYLKSGVIWFASLLSITFGGFDLGFGLTLNAEADMDTIKYMIVYGARAAVWF